LSGNNNVAFGDSSLYWNINGNNNISIGFQSIFHNDDGSDNIANGYQALFSNTGGNHNFANGYQVLFSNTSGNHNIANGYQALFSNTSGYYNIAIGNQAGYNTIGYQNVFIGNQAGYNTTGYNNVFIGYKAGYYETGNEKLYIENSSSNTPLIGGDFNANEVYLNGKVGISTSTPKTKLQIMGGTDASLTDDTGYLMIGDQDGTNIVMDDNEIIARNDGASADLILNNNSGNVGISTGDSPQAKLHIMGGTHAGLSDGSGYLLIGDTNGTNIVMDNNDIIARNNGAAANLILNYYGGNVGIGSAYPTQKLQVNGSIRMIDGNQGDGKIMVSSADGTASWTDASNIDDGDWTVSGSDVYHSVGNTGIGTSTPKTKAHIMGGTDASLSDGSGYLLIGNQDGTNIVMDDNEIIARNDAAAANLILNKDSGNVGIGTGAPTQKLQVNGSIRMIDGNQADGKIMVSSADGTASWTDASNIDDGDWTVSGSNVYRPSGKVGIGTTSPTAKLHLSSTEDINLLLEADSDNSGENHNPKISLTQDGGAVKGQLGLIGSDGTQYANSNANSLYLVNNYNTSLHLGTDSLIQLTIRGSNVGVGTTIPKSKFHIMGGTDASLSDDSGYLLIGDQNGTNIVMDDNEIIARNNAAAADLILNKDSGNVGVGTTSPTQKLHVNGSIRMTDGNQGNGKIMVSSADGTASWTDASNIDDGDWTVSGNNVYRSGGKVGIGTTNPQAKLDISSLLSATVVINADTDNNNENQNPKFKLTQDGGLVTGAMGFIGADGSKYANSDANSLYLVNNYNASLHLGTDSIIQVTILGSNTGIGTTDPQTKLHIMGGTDASLLNDSGYLLIGNQNGTNIVMDDNEIIARNNGTANNLFINRTGGNVAIGDITSPTARLHLYNPLGYNQLRLQQKYTPTSTSDAHGHTGDVTWDDNYIYIKTGVGWKRTALSTF